MANKDKDKIEDLLDESDYEYEKKIYDEQKQREQELADKKQAAIAERKQREKQAKLERDKQLARERIELMKQKNSQEENAAETQTEETAEGVGEIAVKRSLKKRIESFIYLNKWWLILAGFALFIGGFIIIRQLQIKKADLTVMLIADNDLQFHQNELQSFFEEYVDDVDGNGYVHVDVVIMPLDPTSGSQDQKDYNSKFLANLYSTDSMLVITDSNTQEDYLEIMDRELPSKFKGNKYVDENGFSLNMELIAEKLNCKDMPNDVHISIRQPVATVEDSYETAKKNYDKQLGYLTKMINDLTEKAEKAGDKGLTTEPKKKAAAAVEDSSK